MASEWQHLVLVVDALVQAGNAMDGGGFQATQGGYECVMRESLDFAVVRQVVSVDDKDVHLGEDDDMVWCSHCWAAIVGAVHVAEATPAPTQQ